MKALYFEQHGELDAIRYGDVPEPETGPGQIKMKVRATALNYLDVWVRRGWPGLKLEMPHWCGADMAGEIVELGKGVSDWQVGQRVGPMVWPQCRIMSTLQKRPHLYW